MKLSNINPKKLFRTKKTRSVSRSDDPSSFSFGTTSSDSPESSHHDKSGLGAKTPTSVLPTYSPEISSSSEWSEVSPDVYFDLIQAFKLIDGDGDGKITREELVALLSRVGGEPPSDEELKLMLSEVDREGNGCISLQEFGAIGSAFGQPACDAELRDVFDFFDTDRDGRITAEELSNVFASIGVGRFTLEECRRMISGADSKGDGFVCFEDFTLMMEQQR
ncbi:hypothetical protein RJ639_009201 [Escallonia herrerae]|uniref:EF-hand domain-containing protein n=1 Tax=Escallonia herrerae TaxID=1293975 RepID=A0AA89AS99_9ASTE|nr:hypothetical protein RJ639_009201 [Escallonia herrerae]